MARQIGDIKITGTVDDICFYQMEGDYYTREKSSLDSDRFHTDPVFEGSRRSSKRFGRGNQLASRVYQSLAKEKRDRGLYEVLKHEAIALLKQGVAEAQVLLE